MRTTLAAGLRLACAGILAGTVAAVALTQSLSTLLYRVEPRDPGVIAGVAALLALSATLACLVPAWRASRVDPATILRED
jgi:putative ABC transport system permease protein